jgi:hypothetical protein
MKKRNVFNKEQESQIKKAFDDMDADLGLDKLNDKKDLQRIFEKVEKTKPSSARSSGGGDKGSTGGGGRGSAGGGGMNPTDIEKVPGKRQLKMKSGGKVSSASKRADGCAKKGKTRGKMV